MVYTLPFTQGKRLLEIGGGSGTDPASRPIIRPNLDIRPGPLTDIVHDAIAKGRHNFSGLKARWKNR